MNDIENDSGGMEFATEVTLQGEFSHSKKSSTFALSCFISTMVAITYYYLYFYLKEAPGKTVPISLVWALIWAWLILPREVGICVLLCDCRTFTFQ